MDTSALALNLRTELTHPHIASPDVHIDEAGRRVIMYFHGLAEFARQRTGVAVSSDGIHFDALATRVGRTYLRAFAHEGMTYALAMPGQAYRSVDGIAGFEEGPLLFEPRMRHMALLKRGDTLLVFWTRVGDVPERILLSVIDLSVPWVDWKEVYLGEVLRPERAWEGADLPLKPSVRSVAPGRVNELRDPAIFEEDGRVYLVYVIAGESGIGIAELFIDESLLLGLRRGDARVARHR